VLSRYFPTARIVGSDISGVALALATERRSTADYFLMRDEVVDLPDSSFEVILAVEVLEHVGDVARAVCELGRLLAPGGLLIATTPCANSYSPEWIWNRCRGGLQRSADAYGRFATDEPGHLRRLTSNQLQQLLLDAGVQVDRAYYRGQCFTPLAMAPLVRRLPLGARVQLAMLDWRLLRRLPNASTMMLLGRSMKRT
jgi:SAM-dependent methyltransferase